VFIQFVYIRFFDTYILVSAHTREACDKYQCSPPPQFPLLLLGGYYLREIDDNILWHTLYKFVIPDFTICTICFFKQLH